MNHLETELEQSRLRETETLSALKEMQDKVLDMEKVCVGRVKSLLQHRLNMPVVGVKWGAAYAPMISHESVTFITWDVKGKP